MTTTFQPPPTYTSPVTVDPTGIVQFNPIWLNWFLSLFDFINNNGGGGVVEHNNLTGLQGGTANQFYHLTSAQNTLIGNLASGTYTPTLTNVANISASTAFQCQYLRLNSVVLVSGKVNADAIAAVSTVLGISLPISSNIGANEDCSGTAFCPTVAGQGAAILGDTANDRAQMEWIAADLSNRSMYFSFAYEII